MKTAHTICAACGRTMAKAKAVLGGKAYCDACHKRLSRPAPCGNCGRRVRVHPGIEPICRSCAAAGRTCLRCGRPVGKAGLTLEGGVACGSCARYYKAPGPCSVCGTLSIHLARDSRLGIDQPACPACRRRDHVTCHGCGKHRLAAGADGQGRPLCSTCLARGAAPFVCPVCGLAGRRHSAGKCDACYWAGRLEQAVAEFAAGLATARLKVALGGYARYLVDRCGAKKGFLELTRRAEFITLLDREPLLMQDHGALLDRFGADGLRRYAVPYGFLAAVGVIRPVGEALVAEVTEKRRQRAILAVPRKRWQPWATKALADFHGKLSELHDRYWNCGWRGDRSRQTDRTVTVCLRAAARFLAHCTKLGGAHEINQDMLNRYLLKYPRRRNPLRRFIIYINRLGRFEQLKISSVPAPIRRGAFIPQKKENQLLASIKRPEAGQDQDRLILGFMLLFAQTPRRAVRLLVRDVSGRPGARRMRFGKMAIPLPPELSALLDRHLDWRQRPGAPEPDSPYLFPGRLPGQHLSAEAVTYMLGKRKVTAAQIYATAVSRAYLNGVRHPGSLVAAYGIGMASALKYYEVVTGRLNDELVARARSGRGKF